MNLFLSLLRWFLSSLAFSLCLSVPVLAAEIPETPSDWDVNFYYTDLEDLDRDELLRGIYSEVLEISDSMYGPAATPSEDFSFSDSLESSEGVFDGTQTVYTVDDVDSAVLAETVEDAYTNCVRYDVTFRGIDYILLFNPEDVDSLYVDSQDRLWNMSGSTITGRFVDSVFNPLQDEGMLVYLEPCLGNNFSSIHSGEYPNYVRDYYWSGGSYDRLQYTTTYGIITVREYMYPFYVSQTLDYMILALLGGVFLILCIKNYRRY